MGAWPGSLDRTAGRTEGREGPAGGILLLRLQTSWGRLVGGEAPDVVPPPDLKPQTHTRCFNVDINGFLPILFFFVL